MALRFPKSVRALLTAIVAVLASSTQSGAQAPNARVDSIFAFARDTTPGCAVAAIRDGAIVYSRGYGMADLEHDLPITPQSAFYLASVSKQFTAGAISLLALENKLSLDDNVRKFVPEVPDFGEPITIRHLLHHTSGLRDYLELFGLAALDEYPITNDDFLAMIGRQRALNFRPGEQYSYSNTGYVLLSIIVERLSGKSLRAFAQERIFGPLDMTSTVFRDNHEMLVKRRALAYRRPPGGGPFNASMPAFDVVGDGGLFSTVEDLAKWEGNFLEPRVGGAPWLKLEDTRGRLNNGTTIAYGMGLSHGTYRGDTIVEHGGGYGGYNTNLIRFPRRRFSVAVLCNGTAQPSSTLARKVADVFLGDVLAPASTPAGASSAPPTSAFRPDARELTALTGTFYSERPRLIRQLVMQDGKLYYSRAPGNRSELVPLAPGRFRMSEAPIVVVFSGADTMRLDTPPEPPVVMMRVKDARREFSDYAGDYVSEELRVIWTVSVTDTSVSLRPERGSAIRVTPAFADAFGHPWVFVRFHRDAQGRVVSMDLSAGERARDVRFIRR